MTRIVVRPSRTGGSSPLLKSNRVFVIHGRNLKARDAVFEFLRSLGLDSWGWREAVHKTESGTPSNRHILRSAFEDEEQAVVVILTGDDEARLGVGLGTDSDDDSSLLRYQPRLNVAFEAGIADSRQGNRVIYVSLGEVSLFSDIEGRQQISLDDSIVSRREFANRLKSIGCPVDLSGDTWQKAGSFDDAVSGPKPLQVSYWAQLWLPLVVLAVPTIGAALLLPNRSKQEADVTELSEAQPWLAFMHVVVILLALALRFSEFGRPRIANGGSPMLVAAHRQFMFGWTFIWTSWLVLYLWLSYYWFDYADPVFDRVRMQAIADVFNLASGLAFYYAFLVLDKPSLPTREDPRRNVQFSRSLFATASLSMAIALVSIGELLGV